MCVCAFDLFSFHLHVFNWGFCHWENVLCLCLSFDVTTLFLRLWSTTDMIGIFESSSIFLNGWFKPFSSLLSRAIWNWREETIFFIVLRYAGKRCKHNVQQTTTTTVAYVWSERHCEWVSEKNMAIERNWMNYLLNYQYYWWSLTRLCYVICVYVRVLDSVLFFNC